MRALDDLTREANALATQPVAPAISDAKAEAARVMQICNACRYCEGYCAVFPAMTRRLDFGRDDIDYLANLCHGCGACLHSCPYGTPHEFAVNVPRAMAKVRLQTYAERAWPRAFGALYKRNGLTLALSMAAALAFFLLLAIRANGARIDQSLDGDFYAVIPHRLMIVLFGIVFGYSVISIVVATRRFWRGLHRTPFSPPAVAEALGNALRLKYLDGGHGRGCNDRDDRFTLWRRRFHHATFYGFLLCFASTTVATIYHYALGRQAPYPLTSAPVILGVVGGIGLLIGPFGLLWLNAVRDARQVDEAQHPMDRGFVALLLLTSMTGLALLVWRQASVMPVLLAVHLGIVFALFMTLPYGKFVHASFRCAALLKWAIERRQPNTVGLPSE
jgi:citrate/tricarballylate utilization protein